jgi:hypothetical protein
VGGTTYARRNRGQTRTALLAGIDGTARFTGRSVPIGRAAHGGRGHPRRLGPPGRRACGRPVQARPRLRRTDGTGPVLHARDAVSRPVRRIVLRRHPLHAAADRAAWDPGGAHWRIPRLRQAPCLRCPVGSAGRDARPAAGNAMPPPDQPLPGRGSARDQDRAGGGDGAAGGYPAAAAAGAGSRHRGAHPAASRRRCRGRVRRLGARLQAECGLGSAGDLHLARGRRPAAAGLVPDRLRPAHRRVARVLRSRTTGSSRTSSACRPRG